MNQHPDLVAIAAAAQNLAHSRSRHDGIATLARSVGQPLTVIPDRLITADQRRFMSKGTSL